MQFDVHEYAKMLLQMQGGKCEFTVAQKIKEFEDTGESEKVATWNKIRLAIKEMRGPHVS